MLLKKILPALAACFVLIAAFGQPAKVAEYVNNHKEIAIKEMQRTGVPASITLAQGILESGSGESDLAKRSNNHFGIKCKPEWTGGRVYHDDDEKGECFRSYTSVEQSYSDHSDFLKSRAHYASLFKLDPTDYEGWAHGLKKAGYATTPTYAQQLINLIQKYDLHQYTLIALERSKEKTNEIFTYAKSEEKKEVPTNAEPVVTDTIKEEENIIAIGTVTQEGVKDEVIEEQPVARIIPAVQVYNAGAYPSGAFTINSTKVIFAKEGTSLLAVANNYGISYKKLLEFNELEDATDILGYDQLVFLAKKQKKGAKDLHIVQANETLQVIAQKEGIQLEALLEFNRIPKGRQPLAGEKIYLRANSPVTPKLVEAQAKN
ncbi:MAG: mannosyl-glycoprotein endo-beta-N-acetylglucosamidase [Chitinophagaceae bacterium]|jgi:LysM repeat protein|nr:mannosyl-glycoprotein endo-beta-N-acetylglucosamidase [Chitinophagaceae bacterium]